MITARKKDESFVNNNNTTQESKPIIEPKRVIIKKESYFKYEIDTRKFYVLDEAKNDIGYFTHKQI